LRCDGESRRDGVFSAGAHLLIALDSGHYFVLDERAALVLVYHVEDLAGHRKELRGKLGVGRGGRALAPLALLGQLVQALGQAAVDGLLPLVDVQLAVLGRVQLRQGLVQARGLE